MRPRIPATICVGASVLVASALLLAQGRGSLDARGARELIRQLGGAAALEKGRVRIKSVTPGIGGNDVIVEAQLEAAFRLTRDQNTWRVAEVRLGDRQWESLELITEALRREKIRRTAALMQQLAGGLEAYRRERGNYVVADDMAVVADHLSPRYLSAPLRFDLWGEPFAYHGTAASYRLASAGPDHKLETGDDLVVENGVLRPLPQ